MNTPLMSRIRFVLCDAIALMEPFAAAGTIAALEEMKPSDAFRVETPG